MPEVTLSQVLEAREKRVELQKRLIQAYQTSLICFTMNIAGPEKTTPLIERAFYEGVDLLTERFFECTVYTRADSLVTGCEAMLCVSMDAKQVKDICAAIEDSHPLGRLFDMDVISADGEKLSRKDMRGCIVCGKKGRECAAGRRHSVAELQQVTNRIILDYFFCKDAAYFENLAYESLLEEVYTTPKAGLVDRCNNGSHADMDVALFEKSALVLKPYFRQCFEIGSKTCDLPAEKTFVFLRKAGIEAEKTMFAATGGINTHKGAIFSFGVLCGAVGRLWSAEKKGIQVEDLLVVCSHMTKRMMQEEFVHLDTSTAGGRLYRAYNLTGIRGEVASGFQSVKNISLPVFQRALEKGFSRNDSGAIALVHLIARVEDTTIYNRGGKNGANFAKESAGELLKRTDFPTTLDIQRLDQRFIARNLSAGGCADLLAVTYFLSKLS